MERKTLSAKMASPFFRPFISPATPSGLKKKDFYRTPPPLPKGTKQRGKLVRIRNDGKAIPLSTALCGLVPESYTAEQLIEYGVMRSTLSVTSENACDFYFTKHHIKNLENHCDAVQLGDGLSVAVDWSGGISADEMQRAFINFACVEESLIPNGWFKNHFRWIVYKLAALEVAFPLFFAGQQLTPDRVALQIKYRYDREIELGERSALRRITEGDDSPAKPLILFLSKIRKVTESDYCVEVSDGWYSVPASVDCFLSKQIDIGNITVGTKLFIFGASLSGLESGHHPLELPDTVCLRLEGNSVRRADWSVRLGYVSLRKLPWFSLTSLIPQGGLISAVLKLQVVKVYPIQYAERCSNGQYVFRNQKEEQVAATKFEQYRMSVIEKIFENVKSKFTASMELCDIDCSQNDSQNTNGQSEEIEEDWQTGEGIYDILKRTPDPTRIRSRLSNEQQELLDRFLAKRRNMKIEGMRRELENILKEHEDEIPVRKVSSQFRVRVLSLHPSDRSFHAAAILTVYNPGEDVFDVLKQGKSFSVSNLLAFEQRNNHNGLLTNKTEFWIENVSDENIVIRLSTTRTTCFAPI